MPWAYRAFQFLPAAVANLTKIGEKPRIGSSGIGGRVSGNTAQDLIRKCQSAMQDPQTDLASFQQLIAECSISLTDLIEQRRSLLNAMCIQIEEISALVASQTAVWPEDVARLQALSQEIQKRSALFKGS